MARSERILVHTPIGRDADLALAAIEGAGWTATVCANVAALCREAQGGAGAVLVADEALTRSAVAKLSRSLERQPTWSDLPLVVLTRGEARRRLVLDSAVARLNVSQVERPTAAPVLVGALRAALRARRRQYDVCSQLLQLEAANRDKSRFMSRLGHDLRTPLDALRRAADLLDRCGTGDHGRELSLIERQSRALTGLLDDLAAEARGGSEAR